MSTDTVEQVESKSARKRRLAAEFNAKQSLAPTTRPSAELTRELDALSKDVFGSSSRWKKLVERGYVEPLTEERTEYVPGKTKEDGTEEEGTTRQVQVPVKRHDGASLMVQKRHSVESIHVYMLGRKAKLDEIRAMIKKQQDEARAKQEAAAEADRVIARAAGSAV
jgi:hypothetical protein